MLIVAVSFFASCSDDDDYNSVKNVTVGFESETIVTSEGAGLMEIPVLVKGTNRNGDIRFHIDVEEVGNEPAVKDSMYYITGYDFNIPADSTVKSVNIELVMINDRIPTEARQFKINILGLKGAEAGILSTTVVVNDNDGDEFTYESMFGKYNLDLTYTANDPSPLTSVATMGGAATQDDARYNRELSLVSNLNLPGIGVLKFNFPMSFAYDEATAEILLGFKMNKNVTSLDQGDKVLDFVLLNTENGHEIDEIVSKPFKMKKVQLKDAAGNVVKDRNGNPIEYNVPDTVSFSIGNKCMIISPKENINAGFLAFKTLQYVD